MRNKKNGSSLNTYSSFFKKNSEYLLRFKVHFSERSVIILKKTVFVKLLSVAYFDEIIKSDIHRTPHSHLGTKKVKTYISVKFHF